MPDYKIIDVFPFILALKDTFQAPRATCVNFRSTHATLLSMRKILSMNYVSLKKTSRRKKHCLITVVQDGPALSTSPARVQKQGYMCGECVRAGCRVHQICTGCKDAATDINKFCLCTRFRRTTPPPPPAPPLHTTSIPFTPQGQEVPRSQLVTVIEGYTPAAPAARIRINPDSKQDRQFIVIGFTTFSHSTPLHCAIRPLGTLSSFLPPPPPR